MLTRLLFILLLVESSTFAEIFWVSEPGAGAQDGSFAAPHSASWYNTAGNWNTPTKVSGKVSPGDTVYLTNTFTSALAVQKAGTSSAYITNIFVNGSKLSSASGSAVLSIQNVQYIEVQNPFVEVTDNGTGLTYTNAITAINVHFSGDIILRNPVVTGLYQHTSTNDNLLSYNYGATGGVYAGAVGNVYIYDGRFTNMAWGLNLQGCVGTNITVLRTVFERCDHGGAGLLGSGSIYWLSNYWHGCANWDTASNTVHHDFLHLFGGSTAVSTNIEIAYNYAYGPRGINNTADFYCEGDQVHDLMKNMRMHDNIHISDDAVNNGFTVGSGTNWKQWGNTYFYTTPTSGNLGIQIAGDALLENNIFSGCEVYISHNNTTAFSTVDYNLYADRANPGGSGAWRKWNGTGFTYYTTIAAWRTATSGETHSSLVASAGLNSDGTIASYSAAYNAGADLSALGSTQDWKGTTRPQGGSWDIGADELAGSFSSSVVPARPPFGKRRR